MIDEVFLGVLKAILLAGFLKGFLFEDDTSKKGDKNMFNLKEMKRINFDKVVQALSDGETVFMIKDDGSLEEITADTELEAIFNHSINNGSFAVYRKSIKEVVSGKNLTIGNWIFSVNYQGKENENE